VFPREFPFKPPSIYMITPNGRFKLNTRYVIKHSQMIIIDGIEVIE
jgi:ubiquitin-conjugating enzyme E2 J2